MENTFPKYRKSRISSYKSNHKGLNHSSSQPLFENNNKTERNYLLPYNLKKTNNNLLLPRLGDSFRIENGKNKYKNNQTFISNSLNSSFRQDNTRHNYFKLRKLGPKNILDAPKRISGLLDYKINAALGNKKMREEMEKRRIMSKMRRRIDEELKRERSVDDIRFMREFDEIEQKRENMRLMREKMFHELKNQEMDELEDSFLIPPVPPPPPFPPFLPNPYTTIFPPQIIMPPLNTNNNNNHSSDSTGELVKFLLIKKLLDKEDNKPIYPYPMNYFPTYPYPYYYYPPYYKRKKAKKKTFSLSKADNNTKSSNTTRTE